MFDALTGQSRRFITMNIIIALVLFGSRFFELTDLKVVAICSIGGLWIIAETITDCVRAKYPETNSETNRPAPNRPNQ